ncbi:MAG: hypothetical protein IT445_09765 [Phycisphaeraceae bacterium]|nr:hypothetical protein [Phycisphaeraceae bacterium]
MRPSLCAFHFSLLLAASALAQTAPSILIQPWPDQSILAQTFDQPVYITDGHVQGDDSDIQTFFWDSYGRVKFDREDRDPTFSVGYRFYSLNVDAERPDLDSAYNDLALVGAWKGDEVDGWRPGVIVGAGSSNDDHWREGDAIYGVAAVNLSRTLGEGQAMHMGVSFDGNRAVWPDVPLPYVSYVNAVNPDFIYVLGLPQSSLIWRPNDVLELQVDYLVPYQVAGHVSAALCKKWAVFASYERQVHAFHEHDATRDGQRLFYSLEMVAAGLEWKQMLLGDLRFGAGYAFNQEFDRGWDLRETRGAADASDQLLIFLMLRGTF